MTHITLAVTGSISAYKAADITSQLTKLGFEVKVLMTPSAQKFITPLTLQVLSKNQVGLDVMMEDDPQRIEHINIGKETDLFLSRQPVPIPLLNWLWDWQIIWSQAQL